MYRVALDVMGGDFAPREVLKGAELALKAFPELYLILTGPEEVLKPWENRERVSLCISEEVVEMGESPAEAFKKKRKASIFKGLELVKEGKAQAFVSAGNSGAVVAGSIFILGRIKGVRRPAIATLLPTLKEPFVLLDVGANTECKPIDLFQFGVMGATFLNRIWGRERPRIALLSIGEEVGKGNALVKKAHELFLNSNLNYTGNIEGRELYFGKADVVVCDGFTGNICLKLSEGLAEAIIEVLKAEVKKSPISLLGMALAKGALKSFKKKSDWREYGGAPLLGVKGAVIIAHGRSDALAIKNAIKQAINFIKVNLVDRLESAIKEESQ